MIVRPDRALARASDLPENIRLVDWIPISAIAHTCAAMINHGGAGSVYQALSAGLPQIATPAPGDRAWNAALVERRAAGLSVRARKIGAGHVNALIADRHLTDSARAVAEEIAAMPAAADIAARITAASFFG